MVKLGQNFLVDRNILDVIERLAELAADDVVLEVGGGEGVLSERLAERVAHVHVVELDRALEPGLRERLADYDNVSLWMGDALELDLAALSPAPGKVVANLPYGIAATFILRTIDELPSVTSWVVMVQREVGERLAASPGHAAVRRSVGAGPARVRGSRAAAGGAHRVSPGAPRRLGAGRACAGAGRGHRRQCERWCTRASPTGERRSRVRSRSLRTRRRE